MKSSNFKIFLISLVLIYIVLFIPSYNGWGYPSYGGYYRSASFFYWGAPDFYYDRNIRSTKHTGGGIHSGK